MRIFCAIVFCALFAACSGDDDSTNVFGGVEPTACPKDISFEVIEASTRTSIQEDTLVYRPDQGEVFAIITVAVTNDSDDPVRLDGDSFVLTDENERPYRWMLVDSGPELEGTVNPNGKLQGTKVWSVPASADTGILSAECFGNTEIAL